MPKKMLLTFHYLIIMTQKIPTVPIKLMFLRTQEPVQINILFIEKYGTVIGRVVFKGGGGLVPFSLTKEPPQYKSNNINARRKIRFSHCRN